LFLYTSCLHRMWNYTCMNVLEMIEIYNPGQSFYNMLQFELYRPSHKDVYVDEVVLCSQPTTERIECKIPRLRLTATWFFILSKNILVLSLSWILFIFYSISDFNAVCGILYWHWMICSVLFISTTFFQKYDLLFVVLLTDRIIRPTVREQSVEVTHTEVDAATHRFSVVFTPQDCENNFNLVSFSGAPVLSSSGTEIFNVYFIC